MMPPAKQKYEGDIVNLSRGEIAREVFFNRNIYETELERIFTRSWLFIGHESQVPSPGDFILARMGEESVILNRDQQGRIHVLLNNCRHRGMRVCRYDKGNEQYFTCPYHGWVFGDDGALVKVPKLTSAYHEELDRREWGLISPRVHNHRGSIWANWDAEAPDFETYMGDARFYFDDYLDLFDGSDGPWEVCGGIFKWKIPSNWKFGAENFAGDYYHQPSHASVDRIILSPSGQRGRHIYDPVTAAREAHKLNICIKGTGHTIRGQLFKEDYDYMPTYQEMPVVEEYFREAYYKRQERLGEKSRWFGHGGTIFPNVSFSNGVMSMGTWHPDGPEQTEVWRIFLVPAEAPREVKDVLRHYAIRYQGPSGLTEQDDMENWTYAHEGARGTVARRFPFNYQMGSGHERRSWPASWLGASAYATEDVSEQNQREFFTHWARMMDGSQPRILGCERAAE
ncbi:MAG: aromatic ring-hydroxylating dioxygenase subunit alpha [Alphaproteobacteria bacterium]